MIKVNSRAQESGDRFTRMLNNLPDLRLMTRAARLHYEERLVQGEVAAGEEELNRIQKQGAVGDICLRFFDAKGQAVRGALDYRVIGMTLDGLRKVQRSVAVCGGKRKFQAILGAARGKWINTLVTDQYTAERLVKAQPGKSGVG